MKRFSIILSAIVFAFTFASCENSGETKTSDKDSSVAVSSEKEKTEKEVDKTDSAITAKTPAQILIGGSWNNPEAARSEDVIFNEDGTMLWRSGEDEGSDSWSVKGTDVLEFYGADYKIESLTETELVVSLDGTKTTYNRNAE